MDKKTLEELDYYRIREIISGYCISEEGKSTLLKNEPLSDVEKIEFRKTLSQEWLKYINSTRSPALSYWQPIKEILKIISIIDSTLSLEQVYSLGQFCNAVKKVTTALQSAKIDLGINNLAELTESFPDLSVPYSEIFRIITPDGEMKDLPELRAIRNKIASLNQKIKSIMHKFISDSKYSDIIESNVPALKNGRQVLAIKSSRRSVISGIIHEVSQTGQTVFIEPDEAVICSNELIQAEFELQQETRKILKELTSKLNPFVQDFTKSLSIMKILDCTFAAASWGKANNCVFAINTNEQPLTIIQARHPLLGEKAVPIDVRFLENKRILIITGPNTGGKTVTLKTIALFSMLNQSGFPIPASEGTVLPIFTNIFADIGDEQSLDQSLSTFSGHMKNIARALTKADSGSLVLLDEFGSGTDPQEGAAISMAVLDKLIEKKSFVLITTHQGIIKNYGYTHQECINASVEFSTDTLSPTYKLLMGVPGESHALDIALKSGLPNEIVKKARSYIANEKTDVSALIKGLTQKHAEFEELQEQFRQKEIDLNEKWRKNDLKSLSLKQKEHELKLGYQKESQEFLENSRKELENLVRLIKEGEITREKTLAVKKFISDITQTVEQKEKQIQKEEEVLLEEEKRIEQTHKAYSSKKPEKKRKLKNSEALNYATPLVSSQKESSLSQKLEFIPGATVIAGSSKQKGILISSEKKGMWSVQFGSIKMTLKEKDLILVESQQNNTPSVSYDLVSTTETQESKPVFELRLLGMRTDEALKALERQLDLCTINNFKNFSIIHGKGTGVLQQAVQDYLSNCPAIQEFKFAPPEDGGTGKTYVTLV